MSQNTITAPEVLKAGIDAMANRAAIRDQPNGERSAGRAAAIISAWEGVEYGEDHIWRVLIAVKMARSRQGAFHLDDHLDHAAYVALLAESEASKNE